MYRNIKTYEIRYTDVDAYDNLKLSSLLSLLEESACLSADELGFGYKDVAPKNMGFIIVNWYIELFRPIKLGDKIEVHTWPLKPSKIIFLRDYELFVGNEKAGVCTARWCMISTENYSVLPASAFFKDGAFDNYNTERSVEFKNWKIQPLVGGEKVYSKTVRYSDYDHYFHVNNTKYADFLMDVFTVDELCGKFIGGVQISYVNQCKYGEILEFFREDYDDCTVVEGKVGGETRVQLKVRLSEI